MRSLQQYYRALRNFAGKTRIIVSRYHQRGFRNYYLDQLIWGSDALDNPMLLQPKCLGNKNEGKLIYVIRFPKGWIPTAGFFALLNRTLCGVDFADRMGFVPVVDNWDCCSYEEDVPVNGSKIVFEYYFEPLSEVSLKDALNSKNVVASSNPNMDISLIENQSEWFHLSNKYIEEMGRIYEKYFRLNPIVKEQMSNDIDGVLRKKHMLGVHFRGTDYKLNVNGHPVSLEISDYYPIIDAAMKKYHFDGIFLASDEMSAIKAISKRYKNVVFYKDVYRAEGNVSVAFSKDERTLHKYRLGYEVLRDSYTLAACDGLIAGYSQVSVGARINKCSQNKRYRFCYIIDKGVNHNGVDWVKYYNENVNSQK